MHRGSGSLAVGAFAGMLALGGLAATAGADAGATLYARHCAACHGSVGQGDGPAASALVPRPPDLTRLDTDVRELMRVIDGRRTIRAHGDAHMPVWGRVFEERHFRDRHTRRTTLLAVQAIAEHVRRLGRRAAPAAPEPRP